MKSLLLVFLGGGLGSSFRFLIGRYFNSALQLIPLGTLSVNIFGSLLLGLFLGFAVKSTSLSGNTVLFLTTGFCGGFTTFSTFALENQEYLRTGDYLHFLIYTTISLVLGILAISLGFYLSKFI